VVALSAVPRRQIEGREASPFADACADDRNKNENRKTGPVQGSIGDSKTTCRDSRPIRWTVGELLRDVLSSRVVHELNAAFQGVRDTARPACGCLQDLLTPCDFLTQRKQPDSAIRLSLQIESDWCMMHRR